MTSYYSPIEYEVLTQVERRLTNQGYKFVRDPSTAELPAFLGTFRPDAIAVGKSPSLLIEVITRRGSTDVAKVEQLRSLLEGQTGWQLEVVYAAPNSPRPSVASVGAIRHRYEEIRRLAIADRPAGLTFAWSLLEAIARVIRPADADRALGPSSIVELLASLGYISQSDATLLRSAGRVRNLVVHGDVTVDVQGVDLEKVMEILDSLISQLEQQEAELAT